MYIQDDIGPEINPEHLRNGLTGSRNVPLWVQGKVLMAKPT